VAILDSTTRGLVHAVGGGSAQITAVYNGFTHQPTCQPPPCHTPCQNYPQQVASSSTCNVQVPTSLKLVGTMGQGTESTCTYGNSQQGAGYYRRVTWQVLDQNGQPILISSMRVQDSLANAGGTNTCGFPANGGRTGTGYTDSNGEFPDTYSICSSACLNGGNCQSTENQTWTVAGYVLSSDVKKVVYTCTGITINGQ
jgi:hypothetical protein